MLTTFFWGGSFLFTKVGIVEIAPSHFAFVRFLLATLIMLAICGNRLKQLHFDTIRRGAIVGLALGATNLSFVFGINGTSISRAGILNNLFVLIIPLLAKGIWRERIGRVNMAGIVLAVAGIWLLANGGATGFSRGDMISTICAFFIACHILTVSKVLKNDDIYLVSLVQFATVALMAGIASLTAASPASLPSGKAILSLVYCAIFPTVVCFTLQNSYQRHVTATRAGLVYTLDPVWALMAGYFVLGERLGNEEWFGCILIFAAVLLPLFVRLAAESSFVRKNIKPVA